MSKNKKHTNEIASEVLNESTFKDNIDQKNKEFKKFILNNAAAAKKLTRNNIKVLAEGDYELRGELAKIRILSENADNFDRSLIKNLETKTSTSASDLARIKKKEIFKYDMSILAQLHKYTTLQQLPTSMEEIDEIATFVNQYKN